MLARLNVETKRTTFSEAEDTVRALVVEHPQHERRRVALALLAIRQGRREEGFSTIEDLAAHGDAPYVHEIYAGLLRRLTGPLEESGVGPIQDRRRAGAVILTVFSLRSVPSWPPSRPRRGCDRPKGSAAS